MRNKILFLSAIILLFMISYLRYTYYLNPNLSGEPAIVHMKEQKSNRSEAVDLSGNYLNNPGDQTRARSILAYWFLFGAVNLILMRYWRALYKKDMAFYLVTWTGLTLIIMIFLGLHMAFRPEQVFSGMFSRTKNFMLSPLYTGVVFIFAKFFNRIVKEE